MKIVIVGGVAGGASAAARARRLNEEAEIVVFERGPYVSFANCGLPYHIGGAIKERSSLLLHTPQSLRDRFDIDVRVNHEVKSIDKERHTVKVCNLKSNETFEESYDKLILSPGARAFIPPVPGADGENVFTLKTIPDMDGILEFLDKHSPKHATVIGGGYIGLEAAENLKERGLDVAIVEMADQVMTPVDSDMAAILHEHIRLYGVDLHLGAGLEKLAHKEGGRTTVVAKGIDSFETDLIIMAVGVRPENELAKDAGLEIGPRGGIVVDEVMKTSAPDIYAIGDAVQVSDSVTGNPIQIPLASPANRQGRLVADNIFGKDSKYRGTMGTAVCKVFDLAVAMTGQTEKACKRDGRPYKMMIVHPFDHASYYPGACRLTLKIVFSPDDGKLLGGQAIGAQGADKRIDVLATAITAQMTVFDLEHLELCYAPPYGAAKDPINVAGFAAANMLRGDHLALTVDEFDELKEGDYTLLDIRRPEEVAAGILEGSLTIPLAQLRKRLDEVPKDKEVIIYCQIGHRGYIAQRVLTQRGYVCRNLIGGYRSYILQKRGISQCTDACCGNLIAPPEQTKNEPAEKAPAEQFNLDACGLQCPGPLMKMQQKMDELETGQLLCVEATDPGFPADAAAWAKNMGHELVEKKAAKGRFMATIRKGNDTTKDVEVAENAGPKALTAVVFSNDLDKAMASMIIANGAAAMGMKTSLFFTFWGLNILRKSIAPPVDKSFIERAFGAMMPQGPEKLALSKMNFGGMGTAMMKKVMADKNVSSLPELIKSAQEAGVRFIACTMSMDVMGIKQEELIDGVETGGVAAFLESAGKSRVNLFI